MPFRQIHKEKVAGSKLIVIRIERSQLNRKQLIGRILRNQNQNLVPIFRNIEEWSGPYAGLIFHRFRRKEHQTKGPRPQLERLREVVSLEDHFLRLLSFLMNKSLLGRTLGGSVVENPRHPFAFHPRHGSEQHREGSERVREGKISHLIKGNG